VTFLAAIFNSTLCNKMLKFLGGTWGLIFFKEWSLELNSTIKTHYPKSGHRIRVYDYGRLCLCKVIISQCSDFLPHPLLKCSFYTGRFICQMISFTPDHLINSLALKWQKVIDPNLLQAFRQLVIITSQLASRGYQITICAF